MIPLPSSPPTPHLALLLLIEEFLCFSPNEANRTHLSGVRILRLCIVCNRPAGSYGATQYPWPLHQLFIPGLFLRKGFEKKKVWNLGLIAIYPAIDTCSSWDIGSWIPHLRPQGEERGDFQQLTVHLDTRAWTGRDLCVCMYMHIFKILYV